MELAQMMEIEMPITQTIYEVLLLINQTEFLSTQPAGRIQLLGNPSHTPPLTFAALDSGTHQGLTPRHSSDRWGQTQPQKVVF